MRSMNWTLHATLRPGSPAEMHKRFSAPSEEEAQAKMARWAGEEGRSGDLVALTWDHPGTVGSGREATFVVP